MIQANELRIGNYIYWNIEQKKDVPHLVKAILPNTYHTSPISLGKHKDYLPIPLSDEILLKCGFERQFEIEDAYPTFLFNDFRLDENYQPIDFGFLIAKNEIKYLHQLQNIYFALTGQELEIKL